VIVQALLDLSDERTLDLNSMIANTSVTRVLYSSRERHGDSPAQFGGFQQLQSPRG